MSQENVEIVKRGLDPLQGIDVAPSIRAALEGNLTAIPPDVATALGAAFDIYDPDCEIDATRVTCLDSASFTGLKACASFGVYGSTSGSGIAGPRAIGAK